MKTLNLVDLEKSDIKYKINPYPDGQQNITIESNNLDVVISTHVIPMKGVLGVQEVIHKTPIQIKSRLNSFQDLELIICTVKSLRNLGVKEIHLYTPYFLGSRSDRQFEEGSCNYLKDVICPIINSLNFETVTCIDPHSYSLECCIKNFRSIDNSQLVKFALNEIYNK